MGKVLEEFGVRWYEEPVSSDDREGMAFVREHIGPDIDIAAGEYSYTLDDVRMMLKADAVDVQQVDITARRRLTAASCRPRQCAMRITSTFPAIARRALICTPPAPRRAFATSNISMIMCASSTCCSKARRRRATER